MLLTAYEWQRQVAEIEHEAVDLGKAKWATSLEVEKLSDHYEQRLEEAEFFYPPEKAPNMKTNLRNLWSRMSLTNADVQMLHGVMRQMVRWKQKNED